MPAATQEILERESKEFLADVELFFDAEAADTSVHAHRLRGLVRSPAGRRRSRAAGARGAGGDRSRRRPDVPDRRPHRPDRQGRPERVRGPRLQDRRLTGATTGRGPSTAAAGCSTRCTGWPPSSCSRRKFKNPRVTGGVYYFSSHKGRPGAGGDSRAGARSDRGGARRLARADRQRPVRQDGERAQLQVLRLRRRPAAEP